MKNLIEKFSQIMLQNEKGMIKQQDLMNYCENEEDFTKIIKELVKNFSAIGLSLIRTSFQDDNYYVLTKPGKDPSISPSMYGVLALIFATYNEIGSDIPLLDIKKMFNSSWNDIELLMKEKYLLISEKDGEKYLEITPLGRASFKDIIKSLDLQSILKELED